MTMFARRGLLAAGLVAAIASVATSNNVSRVAVLPTRSELERMGVFHARFRGSRRWRVGQLGLDVEGDLLSEVTDAQADSVERALGWFQAEIVHAAMEYNVPADFILATLAVETVSGMRTREQAVRARGGSGEVGAMQILPATARSALGNPRLSIAELHNPRTNIRAGTAYIAIQSHSSRFDPPLVAAGYNAGGVYEDQSARNPWRMRCWPLGTGGYVTKHSGYFNAAVDLLRSHPELMPQAPTWAGAYKRNA